MTDFLKYFCITFLIGFTAVVLGTFSLYQNNLEDIEVSMGIFFSNTLPFIFLVCLFLALIFFKFGSNRIGTIIQSILFGVLFTVYLQGNFFLWDYGALDGSAVDWDSNYWLGVMEIIIYVGLFISCFLGRAFLAKSIWKIVGIGFLFQTVTIVTIASTSPEILNHTEEKMDSSGMYSFSKEKNIVVILLDSFSPGSLEALLESDLRYWQRRLKDFIFFNDSLSNYPTTRLAVPAILSSRIYENDISLLSYMKTSLGKHSLPVQLNEIGYRADVMSLPEYCRHLEGINCFTRGEMAVPERLEHQETLQVLDLVLYRHASHFLKSQIYDDDVWFLQAKFVKEIPGNRKHYYDIKLAEKFKLLISMSNSEKPTFKFLHLHLPHTPEQRDSDCNYMKTPPPDWDFRKSVISQSACSLNLALGIIDNIREVGAYKSSMIVVLSDHGSHFGIGEKYDEVPTKNFFKSSALFMVKDFNADKPFSISSAPVQISDLAQTINSRIEYKLKFQGESVFNLEKTVQRQRFYYDFNWDNLEFRWGVIPNLVKFSVSGSARDASNWKKTAVLKARLKK